MPSPIDMHPDDIARIILNTKPPKKWRYMEEAAKRKAERERTRKRKASD